MQRHADERDTLQASARGITVALARCAAAGVPIGEAVSSSPKEDLQSAATLQRFTAPGQNRLIATDAEDTCLVLG